MQNSLQKGLIIDPRPLRLLISNSALMKQRLTSSGETISASQLGRVAVSLQSSLLGFYTHAGFLNGLVDSGIKPAKISGASAGAITGAAYASGLHGDALCEFVMDPKLQSAFREWGILFRGPAVFGLYQGSGLLTGKRAVKHLRDKLPISRIEDASSAQLSIGVTNLTKEKKELVKKGDLAAYVIASCAIAPIIRAQEIDGDFYIDGGFTDEAPFEHWLDDPDIDSIIIHRIVSERRSKARWSKAASFLGCWIAGHKIAADELMQIRVDRAKESGKQVIVHETHVTRSRLIMSQEAAEENYQKGYRTWQSDPSLVVVD